MKYFPQLKEDRWAPDFGPSEFVPSWGGTVTGVRKFLIAYNVNLLSTKEQAHKIALNLREKGRGENQPGRLRAVQVLSSENFHSFNKFEFLRPWCAGNWLVAGREKHRPDLAQHHRHGRHPDARRLRGG